ncbi:hypothetical protein CH63R_03516 [Colletotrichum higginsianum IMI 349063]|uniref:Uncharacterized protein n=2 Tax=Colletotrichum higginsianum TaxID=80884 RepID=A0A1B7YRW7_COLHI|nr:hypothetical protein CH63R_03516 [Colletotrichum higginsianum IMI 349063]OBR14790.1 hypothetical protein CH63R_03516 [Colletotrichum higginsianum IMI 349063]TID01657.1 hypothetical protein CH35J_004872 [Colletotrichum higginsianum]
MQVPTVWRSLQEPTADYDNAVSLSPKPPRRGHIADDNNHDDHDNDDDDKCRCLHFAVRVGAAEFAQFLELHFHADWPSAAEAELHFDGDRVWLQDASTNGDRGGEGRRAPRSGWCHCRGLVYDLNTVRLYQQEEVACERDGNKDNREEDNCNNTITHTEDRQQNLAVVTQRTIASQSVETVGMFPGGGHAETMHHRQSSSSSSSSRIISDVLGTNDAWCRCSSRDEASTPRQWFAAVSMPIQSRPDAVQPPQQVRLCFHSSWHVQDTVIAHFGREGIAVFGSKSGFNFGRGHVARTDEDDKDDHVETDNETSGRVRRHLAFSFADLHLLRDSDMRWQERRRRSTRRKWPCCVNVKSLLLSLAYYMPVCLVLLAMMTWVMMWCGIVVVVVDDDDSNKNTNTTKLVIHDRLLAISEAYTYLSPLMGPISDTDLALFSLDTAADHWMAGRTTWSAREVLYFVQREMNSMCHLADLIAAANDYNADDDDGGFDISFGFSPSPRNRSLYSSDASWHLPAGKQLVRSCAMVSRQGWDEPYFNLLWNSTGLLEHLQLLADFSRRDCKRLQSYQRAEDEAAVARDGGGAGGGRMPIVVVVPRLWRRATSSVLARFRKTVPPRRNDTADFLHETLAWRFGDWAHEHSQMLSSLRALEGNLSSVRGAEQMFIKPAVRRLWHEHTKAAVAAVSNANNNNNVDNYDDYSRRGLFKGKQRLPLWLMDAHDSMMYMDEYLGPRRDFVLGLVQAAISRLDQSEADLQRLAAQVDELFRASAETDAERLLDRFRRDGSGSAAKRLVLPSLREMRVGFGRLTDMLFTEKEFAIDQRRAANRLSDWTRRMRPSVKALSDEQDADEAEGWWRAMIYSVFWDD